VALLSGVKQLRRARARNVNRVALRNAASRKADPSLRSGWQWRGRGRGWRDAAV